jgi:hypothetical protein
MTYAEICTLVVHCKRVPSAVYIGRPGPHGNPVRTDWAPCPHCGAGHGRDIAALSCYHEMLWRRIKEDPAYAQSVARLHGRQLGCWCAPKLCHGHVLAVASAVLHNHAVDAYDERIAIMTIDGETPAFAAMPHAYAYALPPAPHPRTIAANS